MQTRDFITYFHKKDMVSVAKITKSVGVKGAFKIFLYTDFPSIFKKDSKFYIKCCDINENLASFLNIEKYDENAFFTITIKSYNHNSNVMQCTEFLDKNQADLLKNMEIFSTIEDTRKYCKLDKDEFFYFDIIGMSIIENDEVLGIVGDIQCIANVYYLIINKNFLIPYIDRYVIKVDLQNRKIFTKDARFLQL